MVGRQIYQRHQLCCRDHPLNSDGHLVYRPELRLALHPVLLHQRIRHRHLLDEVHQIHLDDPHLDEVHQIHLDDRRLDDLVHLGEVRQNHLGDRHLDDLVHPVRLVERLQDEVHQLHRHLDAVRHYLKKMDCYQRAVVAVLK
jgi:hypothetical protein